ncbi:MAG TPA: molybdopterin-dependent oxidoreductase [Caulobacteraceae bacterium]|jgi:DMSO/TMAO reductase YedYZ molybdopterin-dependent catalytic subunit|nr:molybdopterin-dependent oxidoreductase [Caulobacteraceae bacterium]
MNRRGWLAGAAASLSSLWLAGCDKIAEDPNVVKALASAEGLNRGVQRLLGRGAMAREFTRADISPAFRANGSIDPPDEDYKALVAANFAGWTLVVDGLVERPLALSLDQVRALPRRTQITRHDCVEGWSCIGEWSGARMGPLMAMAGLRPEAKYIVLHCADTLGDAKYYETLDRVDVDHPQTILAYEMNGAPLTVAHGAPLRLRAERYLGYKQAKYVMRLEAVDRFDHIGGGQGGYWEDQGYDRYGGI